MTNYLVFLFEDRGHNRNKLHLGGEVDNPKQAFQLLQWHYNCSPGHKTNQCRFGEKINYKSQPVNNVIKLSQVSLWIIVTSFYDISYSLTQLLWENSCCGITVLSIILLSNNFGQEKKEIGWISDTSGDPEKPEIDRRRRWLWRPIWDTELALDCKTLSHWALIPWLEKQLTQVQRRGAWSFQGLNISKAEQSLNLHE